MGGGGDPRALPRALAGPRAARPGQQCDRVDARHVPDVRARRRCLNRVPTDRPIDSIDQTDFLFGTQEASNRDFALFFHGTDLLAIKWRRYKLHFNVREPSRGDVRNPGQQMLTSDTIKPNLPFVFDIENDPKEMWNLTGSSEWIAMAVAKTVAIPYVASLKDHPNIKPGAAGPEEKLSCPFPSFRPWDPGSAVTAQ